MKDFNLKKEIKNLNMTQKEFASNIGVGEQTVGQWVRGVIDTPKWVIRLVGLLHIEKDFNKLKDIFSFNKH